MSTSPVRDREEGARAKAALPKLPSLPDRNGWYGAYGGAFVPETLVSPLRELAREYDRARRDPSFRKEWTGLLRTFV